MKIVFKDNLKELIEQDLRRPSRVSFERIGFVFGNEFNGVVELDDYLSVDDMDYIPSDIHGAVFNQNAIKKALKKILKTKKSCFQVHEHSPLFGAQFSRADRETSLELCRAFNNFNEDVVHGSFVICGEKINLMYIDKLGTIKEKLIKGESL